MKNKKTAQNTTSNTVLHAIQDLKRFMVENFETKKDADAREFRLESKKDAEARETRLASKLTKDAEIRETRLTSQLTKNTEAVEFRLKMEIDEAFRKTDEKSQLYRDQILNREDRLMKRLDDIDVNITIQGNDVEELGKRMAKFESGKN